MATNFFVVFPVAALEDAPQSRVLLAHLADEQARAELQRDLVRGYPNVSALDATLILRSVDTMLSQIAMAVQVLSFFMLGTGLAILVAASLAARSERARETALLRVLGASRPVLRRIAATEAFALAGLAVVVGGGLAAVAAWIIVVFFFELPFDPPVIELFGLAVGTFLLTAVFGSLGGSGVLTKSPQSTLREEST
jgi:putative ABC transport system permease protein